PSGKETEPMLTTGTVVADSAAGEPARATVASEAANRMTRNLRYAMRTSPASPTASRYRCRRTARPRDDLRVGRGPQVGSGTGVGEAGQAEHRFPRAERAGIARARRRESARVPRWRDPEVRDRVVFVVPDEHGDLARAVCVAVEHGLHVGL